MLYSFKITVDVTKVEPTEEEISQAIAEEIENSIDVGALSVYSREAGDSALYTASIERVEPVGVLS